MSNEDKMREEQAIWESVDSDMAAHVNTITYHEEAYKAGVKACAAIKDAEIASRDLMIKDLREALRPFAEVIPEDYKAPCHNGLTTARNCGRCGRAHRAFEALATSEHHNSRALEKKLLEARVDELNNLQHPIVQYVTERIKQYEAKLAELNKE